MVDGVRQGIQEAAPTDPGRTVAGTLETSLPRVLRQQAVKLRLKLNLFIPLTALLFRIGNLLCFA
jgi:hypothetical protein